MSMSVKHDLKFFVDSNKIETSQRRKRVQPGYEIEMKYENYKLCQYYESKLLHNTEVIRFSKAYISLTTEYFYKNLVKNVVPRL